MLYCGWDGGGTKTEVCLTDEAGTTLSSAVFGPLNPNGSGPEQVRNTVRQCVDYMAGQAGGLSAVAGLVIGMAGISNRNAAELLKQALAEAGWTGPLLLAGDQEIALAGAVDGPGMLLIAGTGSVCCGRDPEGRLFRVGGYGYLIDDVGSGWAIGRSILTAVIRAADGRAGATALTDLVFERLGIRSVGDLITWLYAPATGKREVASLASLLPDALALRDAAAEAIARQAAEDLAVLAETGWKKIGSGECRLVLTGSILLRFPVIQDLLRQRLNRTCPLLQITEPSGSPAEGAAKMARFRFN